MTYREEQIILKRLEELEKGYDELLKQIDEIKIMLDPEKE